MIINALITAIIGALNILINLFPDFDYDKLQFIDTTIKEFYFRAGFVAWLIPVPQLIVGFVAIAFSESIYLYVRGTTWFWKRITGR